MTLLEKAKTIMDLRLKVIDARSSMTMCGIGYGDWKHCYDIYLAMINSNNSEVKAIANGLGDTLLNAKVICSLEDRENLDVFKNSIDENLDTSKRVLVSSR